MGQFSDIDILDQDRQRLVAVRVRVAERLRQHRENLALWRSGYLRPTEPDPDERAATMRELGACIAELLPLAVMLGIETGIPRE